MKGAKKSLIMWAKVNKRGKFEDGGIVSAEDYTDAYRILMEEYGYDCNTRDIWVIDVTDEIADGKPISLQSFIRQQVLYLREGDNVDARRRKRSCLGN